MNDKYKHKPVEYTVEQKTQRTTTTTTTTKTTKQYKTHVHYTKDVKYYVQIWFFWGEDILIKTWAKQNKTKQKRTFAMKFLKTRFLIIMNNNLLQ